MKNVHPSLEEQFELPVQLQPVRAMRVNDQCWCLSGKKWKRCHRNRDKQSPVPIGELFARQRAENDKGFCVHPEASDSACSQNVIRAHTVQRRGGLAAIAERGHVVSAKKGFEDMARNEGEIIPRKLGVKAASTFMGFCSYHDNQMFEPIENNPISLSIESAFLLSFRAISYEFIAKAAAIRIHELHRELAGC